MTREAALETSGALAALLVAAVIALAPVQAASKIAGLSLALVTGWIVWRDVRDFIIPDGASFALVALAVGARFATDGATLDTALAALGGGLACAGALWAVREVFYRVRGHDGLGFGDVKLAAGAGALVGVAGFAVALLAACLAGLAVAAVRGALSRDAKLPLGALLAPAVFGVWALDLASASDSLY